MSEAFDVAVIGAGAIGMTIAWRVSLTGRRVLLLDRGQCAMEASHAAAGILGAQFESTQDGPFYQLCLESRMLYQTFVQELRESTGIDPEWTDNGLIQIAFSQNQEQVLREKMRWQSEAGARVQWLDAREVRAKEPALADCTGALLLPDDGNVSAQQLMLALEQAVKQSCTVKEYTDVKVIRRQGAAYTLQGPQGSFLSESVVVASGAWAHDLIGEWAPDITVRPVKGQLLSVRMNEQSHVQRTIVHDHVYLVPKRDGTLVIGATEDRHAGFDRTVTSGPIVELLERARQIVPAIGRSTFNRSWTGLRPGSVDDRPWIGELPSHRGFYMAVGHFRNGILLSPITGQMVVQALERSEWRPHWQAFRADRTHREVVG